MKVRRVLRFVGAAVLALIAWCVVGEGVHSFLMKFVLGAASPAEVGSMSRLWRLSALVAYPIASGVAGGIGGLFGMRRPWLWGAVAGGVPSVSSTVITYLFTRSMVPGATVALVIGMLLSVAAAALGGGVAAILLRRYRAGGRG